MPSSAMHHPSSAAHTHPNASAPTTIATATQTSTATPVLRLRATGPIESAPSDRRRIQWAEDVVDNEGLGRKRSKVCCIYHAPHPVGESSSDDSSSSSDSDSSDSDSDGGMSDDGRAQMAGGKGKGKRRRRSHKHGYGTGGCGHDNAEGDRGVKRKGKPRVKRNAYEAAPRVKVKAADVKP